MDLKLVERENLLLGQDFLTWLWYKTDGETSLFQIKDGRTFSLNMEQRVQVQGGEGEGVETTTVSSPRGELGEAKTGLGTGKKLHKAQIRFEMDQDEWLMQIKSDDFSISGFKTPKISAKDEEGDDPDAKTLEKLFLMDRALEMLDSVYSVYLKLRLSKEWAEEVAKVKLWING